MADKAKPEKVAASKSIEVSKISPNPLNPRVFFRQEEMDELKDSIARLGILVPLIVFVDPKESGRYVLLDGERRLRCARDLGLSTVPASVIETLDDTQNILRMFNIHSLREQWDPYTIAIALGKLMEKLNTKNSAELAAVTGFTVGSINRSKKLLRLPPQYLDTLRKELEKPKNEQQLTEDFFLEAGDAVRAIKRHHPEVSSQFREHELFDKLVERRVTGNLQSIVDLRMISDVANYKRSRIPKARSGELVKKIIESPKFELRKAYDEAVKPSIAAKTILPYLKQLSKRISKLDPSSLTATLRRQVLEELQPLHSLMGRLIQRLQEEE